MASSSAAWLRAWEGRPWLGRPLLYAHNLIFILHGVPGIARRIYFLVNFVNSLLDLTSRINSAFFNSCEWVENKVMNSYMIIV